MFHVYRFYSHKHHSCTSFLHSTFQWPPTALRNNVQGSYDLTARCLLNLTSNHVSFPQSAPVLLDFLMFLENNKLVPTSGPLHSCSHGFEYSAPGYWHDSLLQGLSKKGNYPENVSQTICLSNHLFSHVSLLLDLSFRYNIIFINTNTQNLLSVSPNRIWDLQVCEGNVICLLKSYGLDTEGTYFMNICQMKERDQLLLKVFLVLFK